MVRYRLGEGGNHLMLKDGTNLVIFIWDQFWVPSPRIEVFVHVAA